MTDSNASSALSSAASSPTAASSPKISDNGSQAAVQEAMANLTLTLPPIEAVKHVRSSSFWLGYAFGKTDLRWKKALAPFLKALKPKKTRAKKDPEKVESSPITKAAPSLHMCAACSWNDPKKGFTPVEQALLGNIPLDRKPCGKKGSIEVKDFRDHSIWICATHAKPLSETCSRCQKAGIACSGHGHTYLQTGYFCSNGDYCEGTCEALKREGLAKLAKLGHSSRTVPID